MCPKCGKNPLWWETSRHYGPRVYCVCGYSRELGGPKQDKLNLARIVMDSAFRTIDNKDV